MPVPGELALLVSPKAKRYLHRVAQEGSIHTHDGVIPMAEVAAVTFGGIVCTHLGRPYRVLKPTLYDLVKGVKRQTQIIYPKEIGYIIMRLGIGPGMRVIEAGSGSGSLTVALSWYLGESGRLYTYEKRPEFAALCRRNLEWAGVGDNVEQQCRDIAEGFDQTDVDALFLDVRTPWDYLEQAAAAMAPGAPAGFLLPTTNQVSDLLAALEHAPFAGVEVVEILLRRWKPVAERLRPDDRMVAHTGFLVFVRRQDPDVETPGDEEPVGPLDAESAQYPATAADLGAPGGDGSPDDDGCGCED